MATQDAPVAEVAIQQQRADRRTNGSPIPGTQSKRDRKRQVLVDRLAVMDEMMGNDRDRIYREQLQRIQVDTSLVSRHDPYTTRPLDALEEERRLLALNSINTETAPPVRRTLLEMAGPTFDFYLHQVGDSVEEKDFSVTKAKAEHAAKKRQYSNEYALKVETANRECKALKQSIRDRLINSLTAKRYRLNKEREALEISDASALLLHPNQFSITNPSSPGGTHNKRATRLRREMDDGTGLGENKKRKRNAEEDGSPGPQRRALDPANTTPLWQADRLSYRKTTGPIYSIDKLFTDKELSMAYNAAALAAHKYLLTHKPRVDDKGQLVSSPEGSDTASGENYEQDGFDAPPSAPMMERNVSHATRSARGGATTANFTDEKLLGLEALASFDFPGNLERLHTSDPRMPPTLPSGYVKGHGKAEFNAPIGLSADDASADIMVMNVLRQYEQQHGAGSNFDSENGGRRVLEAVSQTTQDNRYVAYLQGSRPPANEIRQRLQLPVVLEPKSANDADAATTSTLDNQIGASLIRGKVSTPASSPAKGGPTSAPNQAVGGTPMSRQSSASGAPMSRSSSRRGKNTRAI